MEKCECEMEAFYELLNIVILGGQEEVFTRYHKKCITRIRSHVHGVESKMTKEMIGYNANLLYLRCANDLMPRDKDTLIVKTKPFHQKGISKFLKDVLKRNIFRFYFDWLNINKVILFQGFWRRRQMPALRQIEIP